MSMESLGQILRRIANRPNVADLLPGTVPGAEEAKETCERCYGSGWVMRAVEVGHPDWGRLFECVCQDTPERRARRFASLLRYSRLPSHDLHSFECFDNRAGEPDLFRAADFVRCWTEEPVGWLVLMGPPGTGKTHVAAAAGHRLLEAGRVVYFSTTAELLDTLREAYSHEDEESHYALMERIKTVDVLVLDDWGKERRNEFARERLSIIVHARHAARLTTIVTTNLNYDELDGWDPAVASRLLDRTLTIVVPMVGSDYRRNGH